MKGKAKEPLEAAAWWVINYLLSSFNFFHSFFPPDLEPSFLSPSLRNFPPSKTNEEDKKENKQESCLFSFLSSSFVFFLTPPPLPQHVCRS